MTATWFAPGILAVTAACIFVTALFLLLPSRRTPRPPVAGERDQGWGDYRLRRVRRRWVVERLWFGQWRPLAPPARYRVAHGYWCELTDWHDIATPAMRASMRRNVPAAARPGHPLKG